MNDKELKAIALHESTRRVSHEISSDACITVSISIYAEDNVHVGVATGSDIVNMSAVLPLNRAERVVIVPVQTFKHRQSFKSHSVKNLRMELMLSLTTLNDRLEYPFFSPGGPTIEQTDKKRATLRFAVVDNTPFLGHGEPAERFWFVDVDVSSVETPIVQRACFTNDPAQHPELWRILTKEATELHYSRALSLLVGSKRRAIDYDDDGDTAHAKATTTAVVTSAPIIAAAEADGDDGVRKRARIDN